MRRHAPGGRGTGVAKVIRRKRGGHESGGAGEDVKVKATNKKILVANFNPGREDTELDEMKPKLLIVDDDVAVTQQLFWTLCDEFEVMTANNFASAIRRATIYEPEIAILDLHLPPTLDAPDTGLRVLEYVKAHLPSSKVFVVSSAASVETQKDCIRRGADGFLSKPLDVEHLLLTVRRTALARRLEAA